MIAPNVLPNVLQPVGDEELFIAAGLASSVPANAVLHPEGGAILHPDGTYVEHPQ